MSPERAQTLSVVVPTLNAGADPTKPRLVCLVNGIYSSQLGGGDIYFAHVAQAASQAGYPIHFFGGHAFRDYLKRMGLPLNLTLTDQNARDLGDVSTLPGQFRLLMDFGRRLRGTLPHLDLIAPGDILYSMSDYWFDSIPALRCRARRKIMYLGMIAPTFRQVLLRERADVTPSRLASIYYWMSQQFSLRRFSRCPNKRFTYGHPEMRAYLRRFGYTDDELVYVANGLDVETAERIPEQPKQFDLAWTGRVHPQKGIDDLVDALVTLSRELKDFRAVLIGKSKEQLEPRIRELGLAEHVHFPGLVSEAEKFRLLKASRVFAMPSRYESWGIVIGEALAAGIPVVAYDLGCYRPVFGDFVRYAKPFDRLGFIGLLAAEINAMRAGKNYLDSLDLAGFKRSLSWTAAEEAFVGLLDGFKA